MLYLGQNHTFEQGKFLIECLRAQTTRTKTPVLAIILEYQWQLWVHTYTSISQRNRDVWRRPNCHISYEFSANSFPNLKNIFNVHFHLQLSWWRHDNVTSTSFKLKLKMYLWNTFKTITPHLKKLVMINHYLVVSIQHDPGELRGLLETSLKSTIPCKYYSSQKQKLCYGDQNYPVLSGDLVVAAFNRQNLLEI
jgi:hypothetical protein